jgi:hypothetical protein
MRTLVVVTTVAIIGALTSDTAVVRPAAHMEPQPCRSMHAPDVSMMFSASVGGGSFQARSRGYDQIVLSAGRYLKSAPGAAKHDATILPQTR